MNALWSIKYRPSSISEFVFSEDKNNNVACLKEICEGSKTLGNILLYGPPGTGKTTLALILTKEYETLLINASDENGVDIIRNKVREFTLFASSKQKAVIFDESDYLSLNAQAMLRHFIENSRETSFVFTANYIDKIIAPLKSRMQTFKLSRLSKIDIYNNIAKILNNESVLFDPPTLAEYIKRYYPDFRKTINEVQKNCVFDSESRLKLSPLNADSEETDAQYEFVFSEESGVSKIRKFLSKEIPIDEFFLYCSKKITMMKDAGTINNEQYLFLMTKCSDRYVQARQVSYPEVIISSFLLEVDKTLKE